MYLPGTIYERIGDLRTNKGWSKKKLAEILDIEPSQISRIESGETQNVSNDILIRMAKAFRVSTDYILGLTTVSTPKSYEISELGLSEDAVKNMVHGKIDVQTLNRLIEHRSFPNLLTLIKAYFDDSILPGTMARNDIINMATSALGDFAKGNPEHKADAYDNLRNIRTAKLGDHEAEKEKIRSTFMAMLNDIKKGFEDGITPGTPATSEFLQQIWEQAQAAQQEKKLVTAEDMTAMVMESVGQTLPLDEKSAELFKQLAQRLFTGE